MDIRPQELPELRAEMIRQRVAIGHTAIAEMHRDDTLVADWFGLNAEQVAQIETAKLAQSTLFHVSREMTELAAEAARTLPPFAADSQDFPAEVGLLFFNGGVPASWGGHRVRVHAASWQVLEGWVEIAFFLDMASISSILEGKDDEIRRNFHVGNVSSPDGIWFNDVTRSLLNFSGGVDDEQAAELRERAGEVLGPAGEAGVTSTGLHALRSALLLMQQPLAHLGEVEPDRAARKRLQRADEKPATVRVIELRRPKGSGSDPAESSRSYSHRWITRGHWRQQWYPSREVHRPMWIAPHVKGPEGAPLIGGEKVYAWKR